MSTGAACWFMAAMVCVLATGASASEKITLVGPWTRQVGDAEPVGIGVPVAYDPIGGVTKYVRKFTIDFEIPESVAILTFDAVAGWAKVTLNDVFLGEHGSFTPFKFEVSGVLMPVGQENTLVVEIDDHRDATTIPYEDVPWVHTGGIIQDVYIKFAHKASIESARLQYTFSGSDYQSVTGEVAIELLGKPGVEVDMFGGVLDGAPPNWHLVVDLQTDGTVRLDADGRGQTVMRFTLAHPELWSPDDAKLYYLWVGASAGGLTVDESLDRVGFRDVAVSGNDILLNGKQMFLKGVTRHDIYPLTGYVASEEQMEDDMLRIKQTGANYVRLIHYPHHRKILDLADELGLMVSAEIPAWANFFDPAIREQLYVMYQEMIERDMNHPAIIMWLSGNARARPLPYAAEAQTLAKSLDRNRLASYVIDNDEYDPAAVQADVDFFHEADLDVYLKITFWLYYLEFLQDAWSNFPKDIPIVIAELGFEGNNREPVIITPEGREFDVTERQQVSAISEQLEGWRPHLPYYSDQHIAGMAIFNWADNLWPNITRHLPNHIPSVHFGLVYEDREPKEALDTVTRFYTTLPDHFVGTISEGNAEVEERFGEASNLSFLVNTINRDSGPSISSSGNRLYFASDGPDYVGLPRLMVTDLIDGVWQTPTFLDIPQETEFFAFRRSPCVSFDERTLYFTRAIVSGIFVAQTRIWKSEFANGQWQEPTDLGEAVNDPDPITITSDPSVAADNETLYFSSDRQGGFGGSDIWVSKKVDGQWQFPANLGAPVNSTANDAEPSITADGKTLYFTSGRPGGVGSSDIWVTHLVDGVWSEPKNLGPRVNSTGSEREPEVSKDGNFLYFTGIRDGGKGLSDVWFAPVPGAPDPSDVSSALRVEVQSNVPGAVVVVSPSDVDRQGDGTADPMLIRRFRPGTPMSLRVATTFNGLSFWRWTVNGAVQPDRVSNLAMNVDREVQAYAEYAIPDSVTVMGEDVLRFDGGPPSRSAVTYSVDVGFSDGSSRSMRSGVEWSVDDETVATIDPTTGELIPQPMNGSASLTITARVRLAGFELPAASKVVQLEGVVAEPTPTRPVGNRPSPCGTMGFISLPMMCAGWLALGLVARPRRGR